jgi:hypothetical protein
VIITFLLCFILLLVLVCCFSLTLFVRGKIDFARTPHVGSDYGMIAAVDVAHGLTAREARRGLYLAVAHDGTFALASPAQFKPKKFPS